MPLTKEDIDKIGQLFDTKFQAIEGTFKATVDKLGKRLERLETGFSLLADVARKMVISDAHSQHDRLLRKTFDRSDLLALPELIKTPGQAITRVAVSCSLEDVQSLISSELDDDVGFEVELAKPAGFRILVKSWSPQTRRRIAGSILKKCKQLLSQKYKLHLQYDKPYQLRSIQKHAHQFLGAVKRHGGSGVTSTEAKQGYILVNNMRVAPEYLVPAQKHWSNLVQLVKTNLRQLRGPNQIVPEQGFLYAEFGAALASDRGVFELCDLQLDDESFGTAGGGDGDDTRMD
jgi:hypothetical protein